MPGLHHVTAIAGDAQRNVDFYAGVLGLRLVKRTVNFDDPQTYHLYYGDELGRPGSLITFFVWPGARTGRIGPGQVAVTSFAAPSQSLGFWIERLLRHGVRFSGPTMRAFGAGDERVLSFNDPDGLMLEIVASARAIEREPWAGAAEIPADVALRGLHGVTVWEHDFARTETALVDLLGFRSIGALESTRRYSAADGAPGTLIDVRAVSEFPDGEITVGTVHHVAWRVSDDREEQETRARIVASGLEPTPVIDRFYFHSVYFSEPGRVLFELATDGPGFTIDEPADRLGERLMLPPQYEAQRSRIEPLLPELFAPRSMSAHYRSL
jgi:catechol 2,3-dioxygenase-like lactoylglutathione lyase family enzyme